MVFATVLKRSPRQHSCGFCSYWHRLVCKFGDYFDIAFLVILFHQNILMVTVFCIQHYDRRGQCDIALSKIDEAIKHTPTVIDLYSVKVCGMGKKMLPLTMF